MDSRRRGPSVLRGTELNDPLLDDDRGQGVDRKEEPDYDYGTASGTGSGGNGGACAGGGGSGGGDGGFDDGFDGEDAPGSPGLTNGARAEEWALARLMSRRMSLVRKEVGDELRANALVRAARKSWSTRLRDAMSRFLSIHEYGVLFTLAVAVMCVYSVFMANVYNQLVNSTNGEFDNLVLADNTPLAGAGVMLFILTVIVCYTTMRLMYTVSGESVGLLHSAQIYFLTIMYFSSIYMFLSLTVDESFSMQPLLKAGLADFVKCPDLPGSPPCGDVDRMLRMNCLWLYFATTTQTTVGFGDISPASPISQIAADVEMMLGMIYSVCV